jgi:peptidoglycan/LPS O-acetylase OafA/YrhL
MAAKSEGFRPDINGLRALSVALVVLFHLGVKGGAGGFIGVDVFFVISGFLMTRIVDGALEARTFSYIGFLGARATRIWPALAATLMAWLLFGAFVLPPSELHELARQAVAAGAFWSNKYFLDRSGYATDGADGAWFLHTWSLSLEWQFYMLYPLLLKGVAGLRARFGTETGMGRPLGVGLGLGLTALSLAHSLAQSSARPSAAFFLLPARAWELAAGGVVHWIARDAAPARARTRAFASYGGLALVLLTVAWFDLAHVGPVGPGWRSIVPVLGAGLVLWSAHSTNVFLANRAAQPIGRWSYSIYLWHWPLVVASRLTDLSRLHPNPTRALILCGSVLFGWLSFKLVEAPTHRRRVGGARPSLRWPVGGLLVAGVAALLVSKTNGLDFRMPRDANAREVVAARESDYYPDACSNFMKEGKDLRRCPIEKDARRRVLVIGDSHAEHLYPWFRTKSAVSVDFFTEAECPPAPHFERMQAGFHCLDYATAAWAAAAEPRYDTVVLSAFWTLIGGTGPAYCHVDPAGRCAIVRNVEARRSLIREELRTVIRELLASGKTVVVLDDTPAAPMKVPQRVERELFWFGHVRLTIDKDTLREYEWIDGLLAELGGSPGFHRVSFRPLLCGEHACKVYDEARQRPIYVDDSHLDPEWIVRNGDIFAPFVKAPD